MCIIEMDIATMENSIEISQNIKNTTIYHPAIPLLGISSIGNENRIWKISALLVFSIFIYNNIIICCTKQHRGDLHRGQITRYGRKNRNTLSQGDFNVSLLS